MLLQPPRGRAGISWLWVGLWTLLIYLTIPLARAIQAFVSAHWGRIAFLYGVLALLAVAALLLLGFLARSRAPGRRRAMGWVLGITLLYGYLSWRLRANPEEAVHFIQYGVLGVLLFRAFSHRTRDPLVYVAAGLLGAFLGTVDEVIQWVTPRRFFGLSDVGLNAVAAGLIQVLLAFGVRPAFVRTPVAARSVRLVCRLGITQLALLMACLANTPARVDRYTRRWTFLRGLRHTSSMMAEYGHRHELPGVGTFFSRFTRRELRRLDRERAAEAARILDEFHDPRTYERFLRTWTPVTDPFVHEARVHLYRRDTHLGLAREHQKDEGLLRRHATVAWRENRILESCFGETLRASAYVLGPRRTAFLEMWQDPEQRYVSPVSAHLITRLTEGQLRALLLAVILALVLVERTAGRRLKS